MINLNYTLQGEVIDLRSSLIKPFRPEDADMYLDKRKGWLDFKVEFNTTISSFKPIIYEVKRSKTNTKIKTNTLDINLTDIVVNGLPYFHRIVVNSSSNFTLEELQAYLQIEDIVSYNNYYYTNTPTYKISNSGSIYTEKVIPSEYQVVYKSKYIEISTSPGSFVSLNDHLFSPQILNPFQMFLPSFYLETVEGKIIRCVDSNIKYFESSSNVANGNYLRYKLSESSINSSKDFNMYFGSDSNQKLKFRLSSHCISLPRPVEYFKIELDGSITSGTKNDYTFKVSKVINFDKIIVIPNNYKMVKKFNNNVLGMLVNSVEEVKESLNDFGIIYHQIEKKLPRYNYINYDDTYIMVRNSATSFSGVIKEKSLSEDSIDFRQIPDTMVEDFSQMTNLDSKLYEVL